MTGCTQIVLSGHRCGHREVPTPVTETPGFCYYHGKIYDGLTTSAEAIILLPEEED